jgi:hypothetical protein
MYYVQRLADIEHAKLGVLVKFIYDGTSNTTRNLYKWGIPTLDYAIHQVSHAGRLFTKSH